MTRICAIALFAVTCLVGFNPISRGDASPDEY